MRAVRLLRSSKGAGALSEWAVVGVVAALIGLFFAVYTPLAQKNRRQADERLELEKRFSDERSEREHGLAELQAQHNRALNENTAAMMRLNTSLESYAENLLELKTDNAGSHRRLWDKNNEQDEAITDHETRISLLENRREN